MASTNINQLCIDTKRTLSIDAVETAKSGHPGAPMGWLLWPIFCGVNS
ncbi:MAG: hypothetical protein CM1200mP15_21280 [Dehalococcoidia bacterium]|nr:MAG: hypothetical protein CM1200mP15_21280 [Dehalococcoidia bacterium]